MLDRLKNYKHIDARLHTSAQPDKEQLLQLQQAGIELVINLAHAGSPGAIADEAERVSSQAIPYINIPVDFKQPLLDDFYTFVNTMQVHHDKTKLVHCAFNWRVSVFVYLYRVLVEQTDNDEARATMLSVWQPDATWQDFIEHCQANYQQQDMGT